MAVRFVVAMAIVVAMAGGVSAAEVMPPPVLNAAAAVIGVCEWFQDGDIAFHVDPSSGGSVGALVSRQPKVKCTNQTAFTVTAISANKGGVAATCAAPGGITGTLRSQANAADAFDYTFTCGTAAGVGAGFGPGREQDVGGGGVAGLVSPAQYARAVAHADYRDTITLIVTY